VKLKHTLADCLGVARDKVRAITPDVGGGFGLRMNVYPEQVMVAVAARALKRPVKWLGDRSECFLTDFQGRDLVTEHIDEPEVDAHVDDDVLKLMFMACHPVLPADARIALTLKTVGGLSTDEIARAFLVPVNTMSISLRPAPCIALSFAGSSGAGALV